MVASLAMKTAAVWDASATKPTDGYKIVWAHHARCFAMQQLDYVMGASGRSYITGFGANPPTRPHHRGASCAFVRGGEACKSVDFPSATKPYPNVLVGGLVSGPNAADQYVDDPNYYNGTEVALNYNAALVSGAHCCYELLRLALLRASGLCTLPLRSLIQLCRSRC
jgi:endoglucanase